MYDFPSDLIDLRSRFLSRSRDIRLVGGSVRDILRSETPKDYDFCTDATPDEQIAFYKEFGLRYIETGLPHGTVTVVLDSGAYEVTSLRIETEHDGRHAKVEYTNDWVGDLSRRDLTINAMSLDFDGNLLDPFNGREDLRNQVVRFVGSPFERMHEDYLRILRWVRFHIRIAGNRDFDKDTCVAASACALGLSVISRERVWMEMSRILSHPNAFSGVKIVYDLGLAPYMDLPEGDLDRLNQTIANTINPVTRLVGLLDADALIVAESWKWSSEESKLAKFLLKNMGETNWRKLLIWGERRDFVSELTKLQGIFEPSVEDWPIPVFPVTGDDVLAKGLTGKAVGQKLASAKQAWFDSGFTMSKEDLLA